ncbi:MAG: discoidin domain-containing protein, partial [Propionibacteriaceae bacterium]|nr:discoidin domain-containing protein [Propionibacteriaceae bacterium]
MFSSHPRTATIAMLTVISLVAPALPAIDAATAQAAPSTSDYRNLALRRAVTHSSSNDYDHTGHLATDGLYIDRGTGQGGSSTSTTPESVIHVAPLAGTASAPVFTSSPVKTGAEGVERLFDHNPWSKYNSQSTSGQWEITVELDAPRIAVSYGITSAYDDNSWDPTGWTLSGSADGSTWTTVNTQSGVSWGTANQNRLVKRVYQIAAPVAYKYYRLTVTAWEGCSDASQPCIQMGDFDLYDD